MLYNGFVVVDTRGEETGFCDKESNYDTPAMPGGAPTYGPFLPTTTPKATTPSVQGGGGGQIDAGTIAAGAGVLTGILGMIGASKASKSPDVSRIKAVCGRKPLLNIGGKKDAYFACADRLMNPQQPVVMPQKSNTGLIIGIVAAFIMMIIILVVVMKNKKTAVAA